jgi:hypothetical protein
MTGRLPVPFEDGKVQEIEYEEAALMQSVRCFVNRRESFLRELFERSPRLVGDKRE